MGRIIDFMLTDSWEEFQRVRLYKKIGDAAQKMSREQLVELKNMMNKINSKVK